MNHFEPYYEYDKEDGLLYVYLAEAKVARTQALDDIRMIDWDAGGNVVGVEFLGVSDSVDLHGVPEAPAIEALLKPLRLRVRA